MQNNITPQYMLQWFSPRWFIVVMGTGALANIYQLLAGSATGWLHGLAVASLLLALAIFAFAGVFMLLRLLFAWRFVQKEWGHASLIQFYSAISIAAAVCATGLLNIPLPGGFQALGQALVPVFWWIAFLVGVFFAVFTPVKVTTGNHAQPKRALGFWFLAPVGLYVLVFAGNFWAVRLEHPATLHALLLLNTMLIGIATPLTIIFYTLILFRALFYNFPRRDVAPSFFIGLAPVGVSIIAINTILPVLAKSSVDFVSVATLKPLVSVLSLLLWSFGFWWLLYGVSIVIIYFLRTGVPVTLGYWAFIFPPAAYTIASLLLARTLDLPVLKYVALVLTVLLTIGWLLNAVLTIRGALDRSIFDVSPTFKGDIPYL